MYQYAEKISNVQEAPTGYDDTTDDPRESTARDRQSLGLALDISSIHPSQTIGNCRLK